MEQCKLYVDQSGLRNTISPSYRQRYIAQQNVYVQEESYWCTGCSKIFDKVAKFLSSEEKKTFITRSMNLGHIVYTFDYSNAKLE